MSLIFHSFVDGCRISDRCFVNISDDKQLTYNLLLLKASIDNSISCPDQYHHQNISTEPHRLWNIKAVWTARCCHNRFYYNRRQSKMLKFLITSDKKRTILKLTEAGLTHEHRFSPTSFRTLALLIVNDVLPHKQTPIYLKLMKNSQHSPELLLKQAVFVHLLLQQSSEIDTLLILDLLSVMLEATIPLLEQYRGVDAKEGGGQSYCGRSVSTRSEETVICKEVLMLSTVLRPYLGYLMRISATFEDYKRFDRRCELREHQAWSTINLLKMIASVTSNFTMIGRYFIKPYGCMVVLLSKALSRDIDNLITASGQFVMAEKERVSERSRRREDKGEKENKEEKEQLGSLLEQIGNLNDQLLTVYFGKYFYQRMRDVAEPRWVNTNSREFDAFFRKKEDCSQILSIQEQV